MNACVLVFCSINATSSLSSSSSHIIIIIIIIIIVIIIIDEVLNKWMWWFDYFLSSNWFRVQKGQKSAAKESKPGYSLYTSDSEDQVLHINSFRMRIFLLCLSRIFSGSWQSNLNGWSLRSNYLPHSLPIGRRRRCPCQHFTFVFVMVLAYCCSFKYPFLCHLSPFHLAYFACWNFTLVGPH